MVHTAKSRFSQKLVCLNLHNLAKPYIQKSFFFLFFYHVRVRPTGNMLAIRVGIYTNVHAACTYVKNNNKTIYNDYGQAKAESNGVKVKPKQFFFTKIVDKFGKFVLCFFPHVLRNKRHFCSGLRMCCEPLVGPCDLLYLFSPFYISHFFGRRPFICVLRNIKRRNSQYNN
jgi:hypothetical protein